MYNSNGILDERIGRFMGLDVVGWASCSFAEGYGVVIEEQRRDDCYYCPICVDKYGCACINDEYDIGYDKIGGHFTYCLEPVPLYSRDLNEMAKVEQKIYEDYELTIRYVAHLIGVLGVHIDDLARDFIGTVSKMITATAEQRARACVLVISDKETEDAANEG